MYIKQKDILYPIFIRWSESYKELDKNKKNNIYGEIQKNEKKEKKMKRAKKLRKKEQKTKAY